MNIRELLKNEEFIGRLTKEQSEAISELCDIGEKISLNGKSMLEVIDTEYSGKESIALNFIGSNIQSLNSLLRNSQEEVVGRYREFLEKLIETFIDIFSTVSIGLLREVELAESVKLNGYTLNGLSVPKGKELKFYRCEFLNTVKPHKIVVCECAKLYFYKCDVDIGVSFLDGSRLNSGVKLYFDNCKFGKVVNLSNLEFEKKSSLLFNRCEFSGEVLLSEANLNENSVLWLGGCKFSDEVYLDRAKLNKGRLWLFGCKFSDEVYLDRAKLTESSRLWLFGCEFSGEVYLDRAELNKGKLRLSGCTFSKMLDLNWAELNESSRLWLNGCKFGGEVDLKYINKDMSSVDVETTKIGSVKVNACKFGGEFKMIRGCIDRVELNFCVFDNFFSLHGLHSNMTLMTALTYDLKYFEIENFECGDVNKNIERLNNEKDENSILECYRGLKNSYLYCKNKCDSVKNYVDKNRYYRCEMMVQSAILKKEKRGFFDLDRLAFNLHKYSSNHFQDYTLPLLWIGNILLVDVIGSNIEHVEVSKVSYYVGTCVVIGAIFIGFFAIKRDLNSFLFFTLGSLLGVSICLNIWNRPISVGLKSNTLVSVVIGGVLAYLIYQVTISARNKTRW